MPTDDPGPRLHNAARGPTRRPRLLDRLRAELRRRHYSVHTERAYAGWVRRYCLFHRDEAGRPRHPETLSEPDLAAFLSHLAEDRGAAASTRNQALHAVLFLYDHVLGRPLGRVDGVARVRRSKRPPVVLSRAEVDAVLAALSGPPSPYRLLGSLLYGSGLQLREGLRLRVRDLDLGRGRLPVRGRGAGLGRVTVLAASVRPPLRRHLAVERARYEQAIEDGAAAVSLPPALGAGRPERATEWGWRYVFCAPRPSRDPGTNALRVHHLGPSGVQKAVRRAARAAGVEGPVSPRVLRHSFAAHALGRGADVQTVQALLGHQDPRTTGVYVGVLGRGVTSPLDGPG